MVFVNTELFVFTLHCNDFFLFLDIMKNFESFFSEKDIILYLCNLRAFQAKTRSKKQTLLNITSEEKHNYHLKKLSEYEEQFKSDFDKLFPKRKQWKKLGEKSRVKQVQEGKFQTISTIEKNKQSIYKTILYYKKHHPTEPFVVALDAFIAEIQSSIVDDNYNIANPIVYPKPKDNKKDKHKPKKENICRPISLFSLKDRIILSFTNKYLTQLFDKYFEDCSLAFRASQKVEDKKVVVTHHDAIKRILEYKHQNADAELFVAECDMQKFYDTVNHEVILNLIDRIIPKIEIDFPDLDNHHAIRVFKSYLNCYSFNHNVLPYNHDDDYWKKFKIEDGQFGWVEDELKEIYNDISKHRIGVPQGGALSGLIANLVLDDVDKKIIEDGLFYVRFCDDMIMIHTNKVICEFKVKAYESYLKDLKLVPHKFKTDTEFTSERKQYLKLENSQRYPKYWRLRNKFPKLTYKGYWDGKSKSTYKWDSIENDGFPWIGFVGYEINYLGEIRIRKISLKKEIDKQNKIKTEISVIPKDSLKKNGNYILRSVEHKLLGMSVGRVDIWNYDWCDNELCWVNGFKVLNKNIHSIKQLKKLDRNKSKILYDLKKEFEKVKVEAPKPKYDEEKDKELLIKYHKPFSYYYQAVEKIK